MILKRFLATLAFTLFSAFAVAQDVGPDALIKSITNDVLNIVRTDKDLQNGNTKKAVDLVETRVLPNFNFHRMTALAVGKDWAKANPQQKQALSNEFRTLLVRTYSNALTSYKNQTVHYKPFKMGAADTDVVVKTEIRQPGAAAIQLDYSLEKGDSGWKVYDVIVAGVSLVTNYRESFGQEVRNGGIDGLLASLQNKNKALEAKLAKGADKK